MISLLKKKYIKDWCLFDFSISSYPTLILTFFYGSFYVKQIADNEIVGTSDWGYSISIASVLTFLLFSCLLFLKNKGLRKLNLSFFIFFFYSLILSMVCLFFLDKSTNNLLPLLFIIISFVSFEVLNYFYNLSLHKISKRSVQGAVSNLGWASGYVGGLLSLLLTFIFIKLTRIENYEFLGFSSFLFIGPFVAVWCLIFGRLHLNNFKDKTFSIPTIHNILPELKKSGLPRFLLGYFFFNNGVICIFVFASMFASLLFDLKETEILLMGVFINLSGVVGCLVLGSIDDKVGSEKIVISCSLLLFFLTLSLYFTESVFLFWIIAMLIGFFVGPIQASSRSVIAKSSLSKNQTVSFSIFTIFGSLCSIFGPFLVSIIIDISDSIRLGLCVISLFFVIPVLLYTISRS